MFFDSDIEFAQKIFLYALVLIPIIGLWYWFRQRHQDNPELRLSSLRGFQLYKSNFKIYVRHILFGVRLLSLSLLLIAMARPQSNLSEQDVTVEGIDIMIALDISGSMLAEDFRPNRLEAAKSVAIDFIGGRNTDRIGLVVFSGESFTQCPLTTDHIVLKNLFSDVKTGIIDDGTAIGDGLATAVNRLRNSTAISKVIILLTDGVNNMGMIDPVTAAQIAQKFGIRVYTIGVGSSGPVPYPFRTPIGIQYQDVEIPIDEAMLTEIATITDGKYFWANTKDKLEQIYQDINELEKTKIDVTEFRSKKDEFLPLLIIAFILLSIDFIFRNIYLKTLP
ncbi:MAG: VWA domain-containing protein [Bacteroidales bacterium]|nr:VWA domain-containing protein [Bacteroidales bacterium]